MLFEVEVDGIEARWLLTNKSLFSSTCFETCWVESANVVGTPKNKLAANPLTVAVPATSHLLPALYIRYRTFLLLSKIASRRF
ncbi:hypothetical protein M3M40_03845 [Fructilactobacillus cliffordii]|uniref:Uncharacterized protein n=1 Tax=Fructilactobacillus cliffordii TaxID=2940299 RepID=A0A9Q9E2J4_9LACO|nr:hypothetical protein [Fructilactobacillus cliffordii]USS88643.1 hypothetical protein M3M40_03845 [Fructilactobacillus cliffordii]